MTNQLLSNDVLKQQLNNGDMLITQVAGNIGALSIRAREMITAKVLNVNTGGSND